MVRTIKVLSIMLCLALPVTAQANSIGVQIVEKGFDVGTFIDFHTFRIRLVNQTGFDFRAAHINVTVTDLFDEDLIGFRLTVDDPIPSGTSHTDGYKVWYDPFEDGERRLKQLDSSNLKVKWRIDKILLPNGVVVKSKYDLIDMAENLEEQRQQQREHVRENYDVITREDYESIDVGDSLRLVEYILGFEGHEEKSMSVGDRKFQVCVWRNPQPLTGGVRIKFEDGKVVEKEQIGRLE